MIVPGSVEQEEALIVAKAKLQGTGTWPVVGAGAEAGAFAEAGENAGGEEGVTSASSIPGPKSEGTRVKEAEAAVAEEG